MANEAIAECPFCGGVMRISKTHALGYVCACGYGLPSEVSKVNAHNALCARLEQAAKLEQDYAELLKRTDDDAALCAVIPELEAVIHEMGDKEKKQKERIAELEAEVARLKDADRNSANAKPFTEAEAWHGLTGE